MEYRLLDNGNVDVNSIEKHWLEFFDSAGIRREELSNPDTLQFLISTLCTAIKQTTDNTSQDYHKKNIKSGGPMELIEKDEKDMEEKINININEIKNKEREEKSEVEEERKVEEGITQPIIIVSNSTPVEIVDKVIKTSRQKTQMKESMKEENVLWREKPLPTPPKRRVVSNQQMKVIDTTNLSSERKTTLTYNSNTKRDQNDRKRVERGIGKGRRRKIAPSPPPRTRRINQKDITITHGINPITGRRRSHTLVTDIVSPPIRIQVQKPLTTQGRERGIGRERERGRGRGRGDFVWKGEIKTRISPPPLPPKHLKPQLTNNNNDSVDSNNYNYGNVINNTIDIEKKCDISKDYAKTPVKGNNIKKQDKRKKHGPPRSFASQRWLLLKGDIQDHLHLLQNELVHNDIEGKNTEKEEGDKEICEAEEKEKRWKKFRMNVLTEILETEQAYYKSLLLLRDHFVEPSESIIGPDKKRQIFGNLDSIIEVTEGILNSLESVIVPTTTSSLSSSTSTSSDESILIHSDCFVADVFFYSADYLKRSYTEYSGNLGMGKKALNNTRKESKQFGEFINKTLQAPEIAGHSLQSFLIQPVQRLCRYELLIKELLKHTPDSHADRSRLEEAYSKVQSVVQFVDEHSNDGPISALALLELSLIGLGPQRKLVSENRSIVLDSITLENNNSITKEGSKGGKGKLNNEYNVKMNANEIKKVKTLSTTIDGIKGRGLQVVKRNRGTPMRFILCNDVLVIAAPMYTTSIDKCDNTKQMYQVKAWIDVRNVIAKEEPLIPGSPLFSFFPFLLRLAVVPKGKSKALPQFILVSTPSEDVRNRWLAAISKSRKQLLQKDRRNNSLDGLLNASSSSTSSSFLSPKNSDHSLKNKKTSGKSKSRRRHSSAGKMKYTKKENKLLASSSPEKKGRNITSVRSSNSSEALHSLAVRPRSSTTISPLVRRHKKKKSVRKGLLKAKGSSEMDVVLEKKERSNSSTEQAARRQWSLRKEQGPITLEDVTTRYRHSMPPVSTSPLPLELSSSADDDCIASSEKGSDVGSDVDNGDIQCSVESCKNSDVDDSDVEHCIKVCNSAEVDVGDSVEVEV